MAATVSKVTENWEMRRTVVENGETFYETGFDVSFSGDSNPNDEQTSVSTASDGTTSIPSYATPHPSAENYFVMGKDCPQTSPHFWRATVRYGTAKHIKINHENGGDPLEEDPVVSMGFMVIEIQIDKTIDNLPIVNSAGESFDPPITKKKYLPVLKIVRNEATYEHLAASLIIGTANDDTFLDLPEGYWLLNDYSGEKLWHGTTVYYKVTYEFILNDDGWQIDPLDRGWGYLENGVYKVAKDEDGNRVSEPILLDGSGAKTTKENPHWLNFTVTDESNFSALNITI